MKINFLVALREPSSEENNNDIHSADFEFSKETGIAPQLQSYVTIAGVHQAVEDIVYDYDNEKVTVILKDMELTYTSENSFDETKKNLLENGWKEKP